MSLSDLCSDHASALNVSLRLSDWRVQSPCASPTYFRVRMATRSDTAASVIARYGHLKPCTVSEDAFYAATFTLLYRKPRR